MTSKTVRILAAVFGLAIAASAFARGDVHDGKAYVRPEKGDRYSINGYKMGKVELYGYLGELRDSQHITGVVLRSGGTDDQRKVIESSAKTLQIQAFEQDGFDLKELPTGG